MKLFLSEPQHLQYMIYFVCVPLSFLSLISCNRALSCKLYPPPKKWKFIQNVVELSNNVIWKCCMSLKVPQSLFLKAVMQVHPDRVVWAFLRTFCPQNKQNNLCMCSQGTYRKSKWNRTESVKMVSIHFFIQSGINCTFIWYVQYH